MTLTLDPQGTAGWLAEELGVLFDRGQAVTFEQVDGEEHLFQLAPGQIFWRASDTTLQTIPDREDDKRIIGYLFTRSAPSGQIAGVPIQSVTDRLRIAVDYTEDGTPVIVQIARTYAAELDLGHRSLEIVLTPMGHDQLQLDGFFPKGHGPSLGDIFRLLGYAGESQQDASTDLDWLPAELRTDAIVEIAALHAVIEHHSRDNDAAVALPGNRSGGATIRHIGLDLRFLNDHEWTLIPGHDVLTAGRLTARLTVDEPLDPDYRFPQIDVGGVITIAADGHAPAHIDLHARWPDYAVSGILRAGDKIPLAAVLREFGIPAGQHPNSLTVTELALEAEPVFTPRSFSLALGVAHVWEVEVTPGKHLTLEQINVTAAYQGGEDRSMHGRIHATASIGDLHFLLAAEAAGEGWAFIGAAFVDDPQGTALRTGDWLAALAAELGLDAPVLPQPVEDFEIRRVTVAVHTATRDLRLTLACRTQLDAAGDQLDAELVIHYARQADDGYHMEIDGHISVGSRRLDLLFEREKAAGSRLLAMYSSATPDAFDLGAFVGTLAGIESMPPLAVTLSALELARDTSVTATDAQGKTVSAFLLNVDMGGTLNLADLPLVGRIVAGADDAQVALALKVLYARIALAKDADLLNAINSHLPDGVTPLPQDRDLDAGFRLTPTLQLGDKHIDLALPVSANTRSGKLRDDPAAESGAIAPDPGGVGHESGGASWFPIQRHFGPVYLSRIGGRYGAGQLSFLIDAALGLGPLTFSMDGLTVSTPLTEIAPSFGLNGIGLAMENGQLEIAGSFLHEKIGDIDQYSGAAVLRYEALAISAIGSYAEIHGRKSLFLYAVLDYPIGGPSFFFVEGLAAGFGYNRAFVPPPIADVAHFPLIQEARRGAGLPDDVGDEIRKLSRYIPVRADQYFLAAGIKFNSFKLIDSFAMVAVSFGRHFEIDVLGISTLVLPSPDTGKRVSPIAKVEMAIKAVYNPDAGILSVEAALASGSFIFHHQCRLTGGFAFYSWFSGKHEGDFVITLGGYHPHYRIPPHYPRPARVTLNWHYNAHLQLKGDLYCALTPAAVMAGGHLSATYHRGRAQAWFHAGADFLLQWKPYHYEAAIDIDVGGTYHINLLLTDHISIDVGASLQLWGPNLGGIATVDLYVTSFDIHFGAPAAAPHPLTWTEFQQSFLPAPDARLTTAIAGGLVETVQVTRGTKTTDVAVINPREFRIITDAVIPLKHYDNGAAGSDDADHQAFGIAAMRIGADAFQSSQTITLTRETDEGEVKDATEHCTFIHREKPLPKALWEDRSDWPAHKRAELGGTSLLSPALAGFEIRVKAPESPHGMPSVDKERLIAATHPIGGRWSDMTAEKDRKAQADQRRQVLTDDLRTPATVAARDALLRSAGLEPDQIDIRPSVATRFRVAPAIVDPQSSSS